MYSLDSDSTILRGILDTPQNAASLCPDEARPLPTQDCCLHTWSTAEWPAACPKSWSRGVGCSTSKTQKILTCSHPHPWHEPSSFLQAVSPGRNVTEATASQAPAPPSSSAPLHPASQRAHWRRRGSRHQPAPRLPDRASVSMGVTGASRRVVGGSGMAGRRRGKGTLISVGLGSGKES